MASEEDERSAAPADEGTVSALRRVREAIAGLRYGEVRVVIQDGVIVQVERTEKLRIPTGKRSA